MKSMISSRALRGMALATAFICLVPAAAYAQSAKPVVTKGEIMPSLGTNTTTSTATTATTGTNAENPREYNVVAGEVSHPPVRLTPDRTEMVHLDADAGNVIVGNPAHVNVMLSDSRTLLLAPRQPGATHLTVLNAQGKVIMQRHVIVSGPKENYVRIRRTCLEGSNNCAPTTVYYCPDICHDVRMLAGQEDNLAQGTIPAAAIDEAQQPSVSIEEPAPVNDDDDRDTTPEEEEDTDLESLELNAE